MLLWKWIEILQIDGPGSLRLQAGMGRVWVTLDLFSMAEGPLERQHSLLAGCYSILCNEMCLPLRGWLLVFIEHLIA